MQIQVFINVCDKSRYQGQLRGARFAKKMPYWFVLEIRPRQFTDVVTSCLNNGLLRQWLDLQNSCLLNILKASS